MDASKHEGDTQTGDTSTVEPEQSAPSVAATSPSQSASVLKPVNLGADTHEERRDYETALRREGTQLPVERKRGKRRLAPLNLPAEPRDLANQETIVFQGAGNGNPYRKKKKADLKELIKATIAAILLGMAGYELMFQEPERQVVRLPPVRPQLPVYVPGNARPDEATALYKNAMGFYVRGYGHGLSPLPPTSCASLPASTAKMSGRSRCWRRAI